MARQSKSSKTKSPVAVSIGKVIRKHRIKLDLSQEKFAELVGLSKNYIGDLERGEKEPTITTLHKIFRSTFLRGFFPRVFLKDFCVGF